MNKRVLMLAIVIVAFLGSPRVTYAQGPSQLELCFLGANRDIAVGYNFWSGMVDKAKTSPEINRVAGIWLGCAQTDIDTNHLDSAKVRLDQILKVLKERKGDSLIIASAQVRLAHVLLAKQRWPEALTYAKSGNETLESYLASTRSGQSRRWLDWGAYDEYPGEILLALHVLARAYRANQNPKWQPAIDKAITTAERTVGRNSELYQASVRLKRDLVGGRQ